MCTRIYPLLLLVCVILAGCGQKAAVRNQSPAPEAAEHVEDRTPANPGAWFVRFFRDHISAVDSNRCPSTPSCSAYSLQAFRKHGFFRGWLLTVDRLLHEADEASLSQRVVRGDELKIYDPVGNNDFWWHEEQVR